MSVSPGVANEWSEDLTQALARPVRVSFGRARRNVIVAKTKGRELNLRLNHRFVSAPDDVRDALVAWLRSGRRARRACAVLDAWIATLSAELGEPKPRAEAVRSQGDAHDLAEIAREVLSTSFADELPAALGARVTWGRRGTRPARRSLQLGSYDFERDLVRVHPVLDQSAVPRFFVRYVIFHELLHAAVDRIEASNAKARTAGSKPPARRIHHSSEFRRREMTYVDWERATSWQKANLSALFRSARSGKPMRTGLVRAARTGAKSLAKAAQGWLFPDALER